MDLHVYHHFDPATLDPRLDQVLAVMRTLQTEFKTMSQTSQEHADALAAQMTAMDAALKSGIAAIVAEIAGLKTAAPSVDFSGLDGAVAALGTDVAAVTAIPPAA